MSHLGTQLAECLISKAGNAQLALFDDEADLSKYSLLPGVTVHQSAVDACAWAELIIFCGTYEKGHLFMDVDGVSRQLKGKTVLHLSNGAPQEAAVTGRVVRSLGAEYLDACLLSQSGHKVFGGKGASLMVSGDRAAWAKFKDVIHAVAPAAFYGGKAPERANAVSVAIAAFLTSVHMGLQQSMAISSRFGVPPYLLPRLLSGSFMPLIRKVIQGAEAPPSHAPSQLRTQSLSASRCASTTVPMPGTPSYAQTSSTSAQSIMPAAGSTAWRAQLERIRQVCQDAAVEHTIIDGFLASTACGGAGSSDADMPARVAPAGSVQGDAAGSMCLESCFDADENMPQGGRGMQGEGLFGLSKPSALDLLDLDAFGASGPSASQLGAELMDLTFNSSAPQLAWAP